MNKRTLLFNKYTEEYDEWFEKHRYAYLSELALLKKLIPLQGKGLEIGVGTGRFAVPLHIQNGIDPSEKMLKKARKKGVKVLKASAESLPFETSTFAFVLMVTTLCFLEDIDSAFSEIQRVLTKKGRLILGFVDKDSFLGKYYYAKRETSRFYSAATFYAAREVVALLEKQQFTIEKIKQTLFDFPEKITTQDIIKDSYGQGGFVGILAVKKRE